MTAQHHMVTIETEHADRIELAPEQFDMFLSAAQVGLEGAPFDCPNVDDLWEKITRASIMRQAMKDPIECFQIATCHISEGNHAAAIPLLEKAAVVMAGDPDFDALLAMAKAKA